ncbi:MAG: GTPase HflX [Candidatus Atribacteria bacterium]|nr:GTPase HflX [Candidatus Atribacteria bacterium]
MTTNLKKEKTLLVGVNINQHCHFNESMNELSNLALSCDYEVVGQIEQNLKKINKTFYIGSGKLEEIKNSANELEANVIIFNNELSPSQLRNLVRALEYRIIDRTSLILEIFVRRAKTREAKLQVEVANMQYMLPRLVGLNESLAQQTGGVGSKTRGSGEKALELDRRQLERKIFEQNKILESISNERQVRQKKRAKSIIPLVALVGYTNSGKSTLMNGLLEISGKPVSKRVFEKDILFATLDTSVRKISIPGYREFLLSDTVGFISNLPHELIKAFRSTLEEVRTADLLLHVIDISNPEYEEQIAATNKTLQDIGAVNIPILYVFNKIDLNKEFEAKTIANKVFVSAKNQDELSLLLEQIDIKLRKEYIECCMFIPYNQGKLISYFKSNAHIKSAKYENEGTILKLECLRSDYRKYEHFLCQNTR